MRQGSGLTYSSKNKRISLFLSMCSFLSSDDIFELVRIVGTHFSLRKWKTRIARADLNSSNASFSSTGYLALMSLYSGH